MREKNMVFTTGGDRHWAGALLCLVLLAMATLVPGPAAASLVVPLTVEEMAAVSDQVLHAKVIETQTEWYNGKLITRNRMSVVESLKGTRKASEEIELVTLGGKGELISSVAPGQPTFKPKEEVVLFLSDPLTEKQARAINPKINMDSPLIQSPKIIGGFQGKFNVTRLPKTEVVAGKEMSWEDVRVTRRSSRSISPKDAPTLERFRFELLSILDSTKDLKRSTRSIPTVGTFEAVTEQKGFGALRAFDPLPRRQDVSRGLSQAPKPTLAKQSRKPVEVQTEAKVQAEEK